MGNTAQHCRLGLVQDSDFAGDLEDPNHNGGRQQVRMLDKAHMTSGRARNLKANWREISLEMDALGSALKEQTHTWNKSCKESVNRESDLYKMLEIAAIDVRQEDTARSVLKDTVQKLRKEREEESEARAPLEEMQQNLEEARPWQQSGSPLVR